MSQVNWDEVLEQAKRDKEKYDEAMLASNHPAEYSAKVDGDPWTYRENGITHIVVRDMDIEQRYDWDGEKLIQRKDNVF